MAMSSQQLRGKLVASENRAKDSLECYLKLERQQHDIIMARNDLAWAVLELIEIIDGYDAPVLKFVADGARARLDRTMPGFRATVQTGRDQRNEADAKFEADERARRQVASA